MSVTLAADEFELEEVASAEEADAVAQFWRPSVVLLDVTLPGMDGLAFCRQLTQGPRYGLPTVILLTGTRLTNEQAKAAGAHALLRKPFGPLELLRIVDDAIEVTSQFVVGDEADAEQLVIYARDLNRALEAERQQRRLLQHAYRQTVVALANALEAKDPQAVITANACSTMQSHSRKRSTRAAQGSRSRVRVPPPRHRQDCDPG